MSWKPPLPRSATGRAVLMGVTGSGKSTVGAALARRFRATYIDGDDLHPVENRAKMSAGIPLDDEDRKPWLIRVAEALHAAETPVLVGCSALKRHYRDLIRSVGGGGDVLFVHLTGRREIVASYMAKREGHFMPLGLLDSQYDALEPLQPDERGFAVDVEQPFEAVVAEARRQLEATAGWGGAAVPAGNESA